MTGAGRLPSAATAIALAALLLLAPPARGADGLDVGGSVQISYAAQVGAASAGGFVVPVGSLLTGVHADLSARLDPVTLTVRLDPSLRATAGVPEPTWAPGLTEAFALLREGPVDASVGLQRLPLETARLTVPFQLDPVDANGRRRGLWGARADVYVDRTRLRGALLVHDGDVGGAFSARLDLTSVQLEAHALYLRTWAFGAGASGTVGETVLYGEAWLLEGPWRARAAAGASGYLGDALWTLEAAYAPAPGLPSTAPGSADAVPQLALQVDLPLASGDGVQAYAAAGLVPSVLRPGGRAVAAAATVTWRSGDPDATLEIGPAFRTTELGTQYALTARLTATTGF